MSFGAKETSGRAQDRAELLPETSEMSETEMPLEVSLVKQEIKSEFTFEEEDVDHDDMEQCPACRAWFPNTSCLLEHVKNSHWPKTPFQVAPVKKPRAEDAKMNTSSPPLVICQTCQLQLHSEEEVMAHIEKGPCGTPSEKGSTAGPSRKPQASAIGNTVRRCTSCSQTLSSSELLGEHAKTCPNFSIVQEFSETAEKVSIHEPLYCIRCLSIFQTESEQQEHILKGCVKVEQMVSEEEMNTCDICCRSFASEIGLEAHVQSGICSKPVQCDVCFSMFQSQEERTRHLESGNCIKKEAAASKDEVPENEHKEKSLSSLQVSCNTCGTSLSTPAELDLHNYNGACNRSCKCKLCSCLWCGCEERPICAACKRRFGSEEAVQSHKEKCVAAVSNPTCIVCCSKFQTAAELKNHDCRGICLCLVCFSTFRDPVSRDLHLLSTDCGMPFMCEHCASRFTTRDALRSHTVMHRFQCSVCGKMYSSPGRLERHFLIHTRRTFKCDSCPKEFRSQSQLEIHQWFHNRNIKKKPGSPISSTYITISTDLPPSLQAVKPPTPRPPLPPKPLQEPRPIATLKLLTPVPRAALLKPRSLIPLAPAPSKESQEEQQMKKANWMVGPPGTSWRTYHCKTCRKVFSHRTQLLNHMRVHTGEKPFPCRFCKKMFPWKSSVAIHERLHKHENPYSCKSCGRYFESSEDLAAHKPRCPTLVTSAATQSVV